MRCIVLAEAKSGATLLALAPDKILMGLLDELGPMDPIVTSGEEGIYFPARAYTNFIEEYGRVSFTRICN